MRISILDDYHDTLRTLPCFAEIFDQIAAYCAGVPINVVNPQAVGAGFSRPKTG